jgi:hypothetical protein
MFKQLYLIYRFAYFSKLVPEFCELNKNDQGNLLKASVLEMVIFKIYLIKLIFMLQNLSFRLQFLGNVTRRTQLRH